MAQTEEAVRSSYKVRVLFPHRGDVVQSLTERKQPEKN